MAYRIEHIGLCVSDPVAMAEWYQRVLGFNIVFSGADQEKAVAFVTDGSGHCMLELGRLPGIVPLHEVQTHPLQLHIALASDNPRQDADYLIANGATFVEEATFKRPGDELLLLRDPWGNSLQLAKRAQ